jgi:hypothetical protein
MAPCIQNTENEAHWCISCLVTVRMLDFSIGGESARYQNTLISMYRETRTLKHGGIRESSSFPGALSFSVPLHCWVSFWVLSVSYDFTQHVTPSVFLSLGFSFALAVNFFPNISESRFLDCVFLCVHLIIPTNSSFHFGLPLPCKMFGVRNLAHH